MIGFPSDILNKMRKINFANGEFYHIYNRGTDKRNIFSSESDFQRFLQSMDEFNSVEPIGSIYENSFRKDRKEHSLGNPVSKSKKLVNFVCYCLNSNHYHFILEQLLDSGISKFMKSLGGGYTKYFNEKEKRSGALFQGTFKAVHVDSNEYLLHLSAYVNLNDMVHKKTPLGNRVSKMGDKSSWGEYLGENENNFCRKDIILEQFRNIKEYKEFVEDSVKETIIKRNLDKLPDNLLLE